MLWVNLIMDSLGSLALATEPPYDSLLMNRPTQKNESIINGKMWKNIGLQAFFEICLLLFLFQIQLRKTKNIMIIILKKFLNKKKEIVMIV
jgi:magnesium-transporting ATPase (P-type)